MPWVSSERNKSEAEVVSVKQEFTVTVQFFLDGNQWGALLGETMTEGVAGFGYSANEAGRGAAEGTRSVSPFADED